MGNINSGKPKGIPKLNIGDTIIDDKRNLTIIFNHCKNNYLQKICFLVEKMQYANMKNYIIN